MKTSLYHIQINVSDIKKSLSFYKDLFSYFEYEIIMEDETCVGFSNGTVDFWIMETEDAFKKNEFHRKNTGLNHLAFQVAQIEDINTFVTEFLAPRNIPALYHSPKAYPEYSENYYAVFFEDPDKIKFEIVYK